jgi:hypothetical protein
LWRKQRYPPSILFVEEAEVPSWHFICGGSRGTLLAFYWWRKQRYPPSILFVEEAEVPSWHFIGGGSSSNHLDILLMKSEDITEKTTDQV